VETHDVTISKLNNLKITGYIQPQYQWGEESAALRVGTANTDATKSLCKPLSLSLIKTLAVICIAFTRQRPSLMPLFSTARRTCGVMFTIWYLSLVFTTKYSVWAFIENTPFWYFYALACGTVFL
jgi:hypothetical protein